MKKFILLFGLLMISTILSAQPAPDTTWTRMYGGSFFDWAEQVEQTTDGGYIVIADYSFGGMNYDAWLIKTDSNGDILWSKTFGGLSEDRGQSVQQTTDGGYIIAGTTSSFGSGAYDIWLIKTDELGNELWSKTFGGTSWDWGYFVQQTDDGGYIVIGCKDPGAYYIWDVFLIKTDSEGNTTWTKTYGGDNYDVGHCVRQTSDGGYIITGYTYSYGAGSSDVWLIKTDANGNESWSQTFGGSNPEHGYSVIQTPDDGYTIVGYTRSFGAGDYDVWLINTDNNGNEVWNKTYGGIDDDRAFSVQQTVDGEYIIAGFTESFGAGNYDIWLIKTLSNGDTLWTKTIGGEDLDRGRYVQQTTDKGYIVVGDTYIYEQGEYNVYIVKVNPETGVGFEENIEPRLYGLNNYPNPFSHSIVIGYQLPVPGKVILMVYNMQGQEVRTLADEKQPAGKHSVVWDGTTDTGEPVGSGIYFYQLKAGDVYSETKKCYFYNRK
ncbi:MAG: T9SS type A sorting domain-containing protein [Bacteroidetes bacterium]|nr:T9SS type A sorting domain-containing protein [Bacteroidota bacterium]